MNQEPVPVTRTQHKGTLGEQIRRTADQLKQETDLQIKVSSRILGAAAQIAENHDQLIHEVVDMVEEDLDQQKSGVSDEYLYSETLRQQFRTLREAKAHFGLKVSSWKDLVNKLNNPSAGKQMPGDHSKTSIMERLDTIESEIKTMRVEISQILFLLKQLSPNQE